MGVLLADSDKQDWLSSRLNHVNRCAHFLVNCVKLSQDDPVDRPWISLINSKINQALVKLGQLVDRIVANESLTNEQDNIWLIHVDKLGKLAHQLLVTLHAACCVDQHDVVVLVSCFLKSLLCDDGWVILVSLFVYRNVETSSVGG